MARLKITEIFYSLQGEADTAGIPTVFVRLTGCPLRCQYCDTEYAFQGGDWWEVDSVVQRVKELGGRYVCVTGGEPLAQKSCLALLTDSAMTVAACPSRRAVRCRSKVSIIAVVRVVDVKTPGSGEEPRNRYDELARLRAADLVKFVICDRGDYEWSCAKMRELGLEGRCTVLFSPSHEQLPARQLADWILEDRLPVRFQVQLHKYLWGNVPGK